MVFILCQKEKQYSITTLEYLIIPNSNPIQHVIHEVLHNKKFLVALAQSHPDGFGQVDRLRKSNSWVFWAFEHQILKYWFPWILTITFDWLTFWTTTNYTIFTGFIS